MLDYSELAAIRLGYGLSPLTTGPADPQALVDSIDASRPEDDDVGMDDVRQLQLYVREVRQSDLPEAERVPKERSITESVSRRRLQAIQSRFARAVGDPAGFGERLVQFWADHFAVRGGNPYDHLMSEAMVAEAIRPNLSGSFADLMIAAETHPRMLTYLDQATAIGPNSIAGRRRRNDGKPVGINENLAREMIELHSLGVGADYSQRDVRELAKLLTGLSYGPRSDDIFVPSRAEPGAERVLGRSYGGDGRARIGDIHAVITDLAMHEATAKHIARKLVVHFVSDDPPQSLVDRLAQVFRDTSGDLPSLYATLAEAPELETHFRQKVRQPFDFMVASLRAIGFDREMIMALQPRLLRNPLIGGLANMGQPWGMPRGPDGWPEAGESWATPQGIAARIDWVTRQLPKLQPELPDPRDVLQAGLGSTASESLIWAVPKAENVREGIAVVLVSAEFNRR